MNPLSIAAQLPGGFEWIIILVIFVVLLLFGPKKIPALFRGLGQALGEFKRGRLEVEKDLEELRK